MENKKYRTLQEFYLFYLSEHSNKTCRALHLIGTGLLLLLLVYILIARRWMLLICIPLIGYGFAWVGHFFFEKNKPATFQYPFYSLASDFIMFKDFITGRLDEKLKKQGLK